MEGPPVIREAELYKSHTDGSASCSVCERRCRILGGKRGFCGSRINIVGRLYTITYGYLTSLTFNPIEKKPLFHYWPGSMALSAGSLGCNLRCVFCQNYSISMVEANIKKMKFIHPEEFVSLALRGSSKGLSFTFNEALCSLFEYIIDCFKLAALKGLYRNLNTNGYMTNEALDSLIDAGLDSLCLDIKGDQTFYNRLCNGTRLVLILFGGMPLRLRKEVYT